MASAEPAGAPAVEQPTLVDRLLPGVAVLRRYDRRWLRGDVLAGITVAAYLVPQVMAYAVVAGLPPVAGLWASIGPLVVYAVLGTSRQLSVGPESTTALMTAAAVGALTAGEPGRYAVVAAALAIAVGLVCAVGWVGRIGFVADLLSRPVLVGYMAGIAVLMVVSQLGKITGMPVHGDTPLQEAWYALRHLGDSQLATLALSAAVLTLLLLGQWLRPQWPNPLLVMLLAAVVVAVFDLEQHGIAVVGPIPTGLPAPGVPSLEAGELRGLVLPALFIAVVGYTDTVLTARAFGTRTGTRIDPNQELLAIGVANVSSGMLQGFPVSSSGSRTVIGHQLGSRTQLFSLVVVAVVLLTMFFLGPVLAAFPLAALGGVVAYAAIRLVDVPEMRRMARFRRSELYLALATFAAVVLLGVLQGIAVAVVLSLVDLLRRVARPHDGILGYVPGVAGMHDIDDYPDARMVPGLVVYRYDSPLFFANADDFRRRALAAVTEAPWPVVWFLLNAEANTEIDLTAIDALEDVRETLSEQGVVFAMARVKAELREALQAGGFAQRVGDDRIFMTLPTAVEAYVEDYVARHGEPPPGMPYPPR